MFKLFCTRLMSESVLAAIEKTANQNENWLLRPIGWSI